MKNIQVVGCFSKADFFARLGRFLGTVALIPQDILRYNYWRKDHDRFGTPLYIWFVCTFLMLNFIYGICFWNIRRSEQQMEKTEKARR